VAGYERVKSICLQSPLEYWQLWIRRDERWQAVPDLCHHDWKQTITTRRVLRSRNDKRRHVSWSKSPSRICVGDTSELGRQMQCHAGSEKIARYSLRNSEFWYIIIRKAKLYLNINVGYLIHCNCHSDDLTISNTLWVFRESYTIIRILATLPKC